MKDNKHIVITGPESSGKTELAKFLVDWFDAYLVDEYARTFLENVGPDYKRSDLKTIAFRQFQEQLNAQNSVSGLIISDTDLLTIDIWDQWKYGQSDDFILEWLGLQSVDLYLLCVPDLPWEYDVLRESEHDRDKLYDIHVERIEKMNIPYKRIYGDYKNREKLGVQYIKELLNSVY